MTGPYRNYVRNYACAVDVDGNGSVDSADLVAFVGTWYARGPVADFDHSGTVDMQDIFAFQREGFERKSIWLHSERVDAIVWSLLPTDPR